jgi:hypothetical protein
VNNHEIREAWRKAGGSFHGPIVETATMPEAAMFDFVRGLIAAEREACAKLCDDKAKTLGARADCCDDEDDATELKALAWQMTVMAAEIRMRSN